VLAKPTAVLNIQLSGCCHIFSMMRGKDARRRMRAGEVVSLTMQQKISLVALSTDSLEETYR